MSPSERPRLPSTFYRLSAPRAALFVAFAFAMYLVPAAGAAALVPSAIPLGWKLAALILLSLWASQGLHLLAFVGHDGIHNNLHKNKYVSMPLAILCSSPIATYLIVGYAVTHWNHHRFTNQASDPDAAIYSRFRGFWSRLFLSRSLGNRTYMRNTARLALGRSVASSYRMPFTDKELAVLARVNIAVSLVWSAGYVLFTIAAPTAAIFAAWLPLVFAYFGTGLRAYIEHGGTTVGLFADTRSYISPLYTFLFFGNNYHLEHHLYPSIPCYRLPAVHRYIREKLPARVASATAAGAFEIARYLAAGHQYPNPAAADLADDPLRDDRHRAA